MKINIKGIWIPIEILVNKDLSDKEKLIYSIYEHNKPIIITTNFSENQLIDIFTVGKNKSIEAIISRLKEICLSIEIFDNDYRYKI